MKNKKPKSLSKAIGNPFLKILAVLVMMAVILSVGVIAGALLRSGNLLNKQIVDQTNDNKVEDEVKDEVDHGKADYKYSQGALQIDWSGKESPKHIKMSDRFASAIIKSRASGFSSSEDYETDLSKQFYKDNEDEKVYVLGEVTDGEYEGYSLVLISWEDEMGMGSTTNEIYALIGADKKYVVLYKYGRESFVINITHQNAQETLGELMIDEIGDELVFEYHLDVPGLDAQPIVTDVDGNRYQLSKTNNFPYSGDKDLESKKEIKLENDSSTLQRGFSSFFMTQADGRVLEYDLVIPFWAKPSGNAMDQSVYAPAIKWTDNSVSKDSYVKAMPGGCGFLSATFVDNKVEEDDLVQTGAVQGHDGKDYKIFEPALDSDEIFKEGSRFNNLYYQNYLGFIYSQPDYDPEKQGYESIKYFKRYIDSHPILYWKDAYDRWIRFEHVDAIIPAECGKPVIYLYPEEETDMRVEVAPKGGFTFTEPEYGDGWEVTAYPDGKVYNHGDNTVYPYLFWEGRGGAYQSPETFWVVDQDRVESFLVDTLSQVGLNQTEIADFNEFWLPRMQAAPYYKIGFHGTRVMDAIAPLTISEEPDSIFRILMDFEELSEPIDQNPPRNLRPFERNGFTVVEWGGVIR